MSNDLKRTDIGFVRPSVAWSELTEGFPSLARLALVFQRQAASQNSTLPERWLRRRGDRQGHQPTCQCHRRHEAGKGPPIFHCQGTCQHPGCSGARYWCQRACRGTLLARTASPAALDAVPNPPPQGMEPKAPQCVNGACDVGELDPCRSRNGLRNTCRT